MKLKFCLHVFSNISILWFILLIISAIILTIDATQTSQDALETSLSGARVRNTKSPGGKLGPAANPSGDVVVTAHAAPSSARPHPRTAYTSTRHRSRVGDDFHLQKMSAALVNAPSYFDEKFRIKDDVMARKAAFSNRRPQPNKTKNKQLDSHVLRGRKLGPVEVGKLVIAFTDVAKRIGDYQRQAASTMRLSDNNSNFTASIASTRNNILQLVRTYSTRHQARQLFTQGVTVQDVLPLLISILETSKSTSPQQTSEDLQGVLGSPFEPDDAISNTLNKNAVVLPSPFLHADVALPNDVLKNNGLSLSAPEKFDLNVTISLDGGNQPHQAGPVLRPFIRPEIDANKKFEFFMANSTTAPVSTTTPNSLFSFNSDDLSVYVPNPNASNNFNKLNQLPSYFTHVRPTAGVSSTMMMGFGVLDHAFFRSISIEMLHNMMMYEFY